MKFQILLSILLLSSLLTAQEGYSVDPYTFGLSLGGSGALTDSLQEADDTQLFTAAINNSWNLNNYVSVPLDLEWYSLKNFGFFTGIEVSIGNQQIRPFLGANIGAAYTDISGFGPAVKAQLGLQLNLTRTFGIKIKAPYKIIFNDNKDQMFGAEIGLIWFSRFKNVQTIM